MACSISPSRTSIGVNSTRSDGATAWIAPNWPIPDVMEGSRTTAARGGVSANALKIAPAPPEVDADVATLAPTETLQTLPEGCNTGLCRRIVGGRVQERADAPHALRLLRACREWPCHRRAAEQRDELAAFQLVELHSVPHQPGPDRRISDWQGSVRK